MKAIKDCKWRVYIMENVSPGCVNWRAATSDDTGLQTRYLNPKGEWPFRTKRKAKNHWERFAKANKIPKKNWEYA